MSGADISRFLAAPESVIHNRAERQKLIERKARELARQKQLAAAKLKTPPTDEDVLADIIRVAEDRETNPLGYQFRSISRARYEKFGHFPIVYVDRRYGMWHHALEVAGLRDKVGTRLWRRKQAQASRDEHTARLFKRCVQPYVAKAAAFRDLHKPYLLLSISDTHGAMLCPFVFTAFLQSIRDLKPSGVLLNGDIIDGTSISRHPKIPGWTPSLRSELQFQREMFRCIRAVHDGDLFLTGGNHDPVERIVQVLTHIDPVVADFTEEAGTRVDTLLGLDKFDVKLFLGGSILSPKGQEDAKPGFILFDFYRIHHGTILGQDPARGELRAAGRSGQSGHVHRASLSFGTTERDEGMSWMCTPMGARHEVGRAYIKGTSTGWQRGFGVAWLYPNGGVHQYPVIVQPQERVTVEGHTYQRTRHCIDPDPMSVWLEGWNP